MQQRDLHATSDRYKQSGNRCLNWSSAVYTGISREASRVLLRLTILCFIRYGTCHYQRGTHPKRLVRYKWKVRNRRLLLPPFSGYTRVSDKLSVCKHGFQFNSYIRRRIFWLPASQTDAKAATQTEWLSFSQKQANKPQMPPVSFLSLLKQLTI